MWTSVVTLRRTVQSRGGDIRLIGMGSKVRGGGNLESASRDDS